MQRERPLLFDCAGESILGILHSAPATDAGIGVLLVVGGPQYRVGSHRQFVLLARDLAEAGIPVLRFDYRGMGDSGGAARDFEDIATDIRAALDNFFLQEPGMRGVVLWGLCDAATANAFYAADDTRVLGQVALNPWVRTAEGEAQAYIQHYYLHRLFSAAFWRKVLGLRFDIRGSVADFARKLGQSRGGGNAGQGGDTPPLPERLCASQTRFRGPTMVVLSGQDLTAKEYENRVAESKPWRDWLGSAQVEVRRLEAADHTFSRAAWRDQVSAWTVDWIRRMFAA